MIQHTQTPSQRFIPQSLKEQKKISRFRGKDVHLGKLKKQIDLRFIKIKKMLSLDYTQDIPEVNRQDQGCQTQNLWQPRSCPRALEPSPRFMSPCVLNIIKQKDSTEKRNFKYPNHPQISIQNNNYQYASISKQNYKIGQLEDLSATKNYYYKNHHIPKIQKYSQQSQSSHSQINKHSKPKIKSNTDLLGSLEFKFKDALTKRNKRSRKIEGSLYPTIKEAKSLDHSLSMSEYSEQSAKRQRYSYSNTQRKFCVDKKLKIADQTLPFEQQSRIIVREECKQQILNVIQKMAKRRRNEADSKLRSNLINRINQKYGDYYDKI